MSPFQMIYRRGNFVNRLVSVLKEMHFEGQRTPDTRSLNSAIAKMATSYGLHVWTKNPGDDKNQDNDHTHISGHEWLYDLFCYRFEDENAWENFFHQPMIDTKVDRIFLENILQNENYAFCDTILIMESEWGGTRKESKYKDGNDPYGEVKFDFQKLLVSNAEIKLMVYGHHGGKEYADEDLDHYFQSRIDAYRQGAQTDFFIFARYSYRKNGKRTCTVSSYTRNGEWKQL